MIITCFYIALVLYEILHKALYSVLLLPLVTGFNINPTRMVHLLNSLRSILPRRQFRGAHMLHQATNNVRILPGTHLYTWVGSSIVDKVSCWRELKVPGIDGNQTRYPLIQSQGFNPVHHGTSKHKQLKLTSKAPNNHSHTWTCGRISRFLKVQSIF